MSSTNRKDACSSKNNGAGTKERISASLEGYRPTFLSDLIRVGARHDGGYVVNKRSILQSQYLMSFGVSTDWSFELDFLNRKPDVTVCCFDYSVSKGVFRTNMLDALSEILSLRFALLTLSLNWPRMRRKLWALKSWTHIYRGFSRFIAKANVRFDARGISNEKNAQFVTFAEAFQSLSPDEIPENSVFVKMDIELSEFRVLPDLLRFEQYINGLAIEFHDLNILWAKFAEIMEQLRIHYEITHIHGNNYSGQIPNSRVPKVLEVTLLKKCLILEEHPVRDNVTYPIPQLDFPNNPDEEDYSLVF